MARKNTAALSTDNINQFNPDDYDVVEIQESFEKTVELLTKNGIEVMKYYPSPDNFILVKKPNTDKAKELLGITVEPETGETASVELTTADAAAETDETGNNDGATQVEVISCACDGLDVDELKQVIDYCTSRIDELQREEVKALEAEMRAIQDKLMALKGHRNSPAAMRTESTERKRTEKVVINPDNPTQIYKFGKTPEWLTALCAKTGKTVSDLRVDQPV